MKIAVISHYYPPDKAGDIPRTIARSMSGRGHDVRVLTTFPHYARGRIANGYRQSFSHIESDGEVKVRRVPIIPSHSRNAIGRIANYLSFPASARLFSKWLSDVDVIFVHGTPATPAEVARSLAARKSIPFVFCVQDIWPESVTESGFLPRPILNQMKKGIDRWLGSVYAQASAVIAIAPSARELLIERGVPRSRAHLIYNWSAKPKEFNRPNTDGLSLLYAGNLGDFQDLETVVKAIRIVSHLDNLKLTVAGSGVSEAKLKRLVADLGLEDQVVFLGQVEKSNMGKVYSAADFQIIPLKNIDIFAGTIPSKFQAGLAYGVPVITTVKGDVSNLVESNRLGFTANPEDPNDLARAFAAAYETSPEERAGFSQRCLKFVEDNFTEERAMDRIEELLIAAAASRFTADRDQRD